MRQGEVVVVQFVGAGASDVGLVRTHDEDSAFVGPICLLVADGVGGAAAGEVASATVAHVVAASVAGRALAEPVGLLRSSVRLAQEQLRLGVRREPRWSGMATTLTALVTDGEECALVHVGDSRGYVLRDGELVRVTSDHTFVQRLVDEGTLSERDRETHPWRHMVLRSLDGKPDELGDVRRIRLHLGDRVLLASDGLTDLVDERRIERVLLAHDDATAVELLVAAALEAGGRDNVTCVAATVVDGLPTSYAGRMLGAARDPSLVVDDAAVAHEQRSA